MTQPRVALVTLGCARNEVDSEELAGRFAAAGYDLVDDASSADAVVVNTCGFVEAAKQDSINTVLEAAGLKGESGPRAVVAVGCLAERYGEQLAASLPEADAVLGFDHYADLPARITEVLAGHPPASHAPKDRRLLPIVEAARGVEASGGVPAARRRLSTGPVAPLKLASGCDRRCTFCAIPFFRGSFVSRRPHELLEEARWLATQGVRELHLVSENTTSYGKDLGDIRLLESLLPELAAIEGIVRLRLAYLQPAEMRPSLVEAIATTPGVVAYYDLSFQHASGPVLKRMRRFGDRETFLGLLDGIRAVVPEAGVRSNFILGFPGETKADVNELERFLDTARLDAIGLFGYSDEDGTEAVALPGHVRRETIARRLDRLSTQAEIVTADRAAERVGALLSVLVESLDSLGGEGHADHQGPEDGSVQVVGLGLAVGDLVTARVTECDGVDLVASLVEVVSPAAGQLAGAR